MAYYAELRAEDLAKRTSQIASQNLASTFFKATQQASQTRAREEEARKTATTARLALYHPALATVKPMLPSEREALEREKRTAVHEIIRLKQPMVEGKPSPERERLRRAELASEELMLSTLKEKFPKIEIPEFTDIAGYTIKTVYLIGAIALIIILTFVLK